MDLSNAHTIANYQLRSEPCGTQNVLERCVRRQWRRVLYLDSWDSTLLKRIGPYWTATPTGYTFSDLVTTTWRRRCRQARTASNARLRPAAISSCHAVSLTLRFPRNPEMSCRFTPTNKLRLVTLRLHGTSVRVSHEADALLPGLRALPLLEDLSHHVRRHQQ